MAVELGPNQAVRSVAAGGSHTCALLDDGAVKCFGDNYWGQLGLGDRRSRGSAASDLAEALPAVDLGGLAVALAAGQNHTCALLADGRVKCWGANESGQLGVGDVSARGDEPGELGESLASVEFGAGKAAVAIAAGANHNCAILADRRVACWGANENAQLGPDTSNNSGDLQSELGDNLPSVVFESEFRVTALALGAHHNCALSEDGRVACWGNNGTGQLGAVSLESARTPGIVDLGSAKRAFAISAGAYHSCAILDGGELRCWGFNDQGQLGAGTVRSMNRSWLPAADSRPVLGGEAMGSPVPVADVSGGTSFTCAVLATQAVKCWGDNSFEQLGAPGETSGDVSVNLGD